MVWSEQPAKLRDVSEVCSESGCRKVLVRGQDANVQLTTMEIFRFGEAVAKQDLRVAIVNTSNASRTDEEFLENVSTNRGSPIKFFNSEEDAKKWLGV